MNFDVKKNYFDNIREVISIDIFKRSIFNIIPESHTKFYTKKTTNVIVRTNKTGRQRKSIQ